MECQYCNRVLWGDYVYLGHGHYRHLECSPGSKSWCEWYKKHSAGTPEGAILYAHATEQNKLLKALDSQETGVI